MIPLSPRSHDKPSSTARTYHEFFIKGSGVSSNFIEKASDWIQNIDISPHLFGKCLYLIKKMGYTSEGPLGKGKGIAEPLVV